MKPLASLFLLLAAGTLGAEPVQDYFPMAVWYGGGKARAPMELKGTDAFS